MYRIKQGFNSYIPKDCENETDCFQSPIHTPDWILKQYPKIALGICDLDVFSDNTFIFATRLLKNKIKVDIKFFTYLTHGVLDNKDLGYDSASIYYDESVKVMNEFINE